MKCPQCDTPLRSVHHNSILMEMCPSCRGAWLTGEELERLSRGTAPAQDRREPFREEYSPYPAAAPNYRRHHSDDSDDDYRRHGHGKSGRRRGWMNRLFDMFD